MEVAFVRLTETAMLPSYESEGAAGMDLRSDEFVVIPPNCRRLIKTNVGIALEGNVEAQVRPRSGLALHHGVTVLNAPGTIDPDYRGGIGVILYNSGVEHFYVNRGDRIAQLVFSRFERVEICPVSKLDATERGAGGFGSSGVK